MLTLRKSVLNVCFGIFDVCVNVYDLNIHVVGKKNLHCLLSIYVCIVYICKHVVHKGQNGLLLMNKLILSYLIIA